MQKHIYYIYKADAQDINIKWRVWPQARLAEAWLAMAIQLVLTNSAQLLFRYKGLFCANKQLFTHTESAIFFINRKLGVADFARASELYLLLPTCVEQKSRLGKS